MEVSARRRPSCGAPFIGGRGMEVSARPRPSCGAPFIKSCTLHARASLVMHARRRARSCARAR
eukprot:4408298-Pleurochrysis_carterae.AAC.1